MAGFNFMNTGMLGDMTALDPVGGLVDPVAQAQAAQMMQAPATPFMASPESLLDKPNLSEIMLNAGIAMINASENGSSTAGALAAGLQGYSDTMETHRQKRRQQRADRLAEYDLLGRIRERQMTELQTAKRMQMLEELKGTNPELATLIDLDPDAAAGVIAERFKPKERKIIEQGDVSYYADTGEPVLPNVPVNKTPFSGTGMEAQVNNILLQGDPATPEYLAAYNIAAQTKTSIGPDGTPVTVVPNMSAYRKPVVADQIPIESMGLPELDAQGMENYGASTTTPDRAPMPPDFVNMGDAGGVTFGDPQMVSVPGLEIQPGARPTAQDAKEIKSMMAASKNLEALVEERARIVEKNPAPISGSADAQKLDQNLGQIAAEYKALKQLGTYDTGTENLVKQIFGDPVVRGNVKDTAKNITKMRSGKELSADMTASAKAHITDSLSSELSARGYIMPKAGQNTTAPAAPVTDVSQQKKERAKELLRKKHGS